MSRARIPRFDVRAIAAICHEANRRLCLEHGDGSQPEWWDAPMWQVESAINGVEAILAGRVTRPEQSHESWAAQKLAEGWTYGPVKDPEKKEHPCLVPFNELPEDQQAKDHLFLSIVLALSTVPDNEIPRCNFCGGPHAPRDCTEEMRRRIKLVVEEYDHEPPVSHEALESLRSFTQ